MAITEHSESFSALRQLDVKVYVLDYKYKVLDEISGVIESANISIDADSDIRRTVNLSMVLNQGISKRAGSYNDYDNNTRYYKGDIVKFENKLYECTSTKAIEINMVDSNGDVLTDEDDNILTIISGDGTYIVGIAPFYSLFWTEYTISIFSSSIQYWQAGNPYWFDKYIKIQVGIKNKGYYQYDVTEDYDNARAYYIGNIVKYGGRLYQCKTVDTIPLNLLVQGDTEGTTEQVLVYDDDTQTPPTTSTLRVMSTDAIYIRNIPPTDVNYWDEVEEYTWVNQGIYLINAPSITYNATDNTLSFQAVDLMSKLTGMRNGYLEGMEYQVEAGSNLTGSMRSILEEQGFTQMILNTPSINETPIDINIDIGSTAYDLLSQLRDVNPNWEMFFDVNGIFRFQQIPSGNNEVSEFGDEVWEKVGLGYTLDTSFEDVKNYVDVVGKQIEPDETATATYSGATATVTLARTWASYVSSSSEIPVVWYIGFTIGSGTTPTLLSTPIRSITLNDSAGSVSQTITIGTDEEPIWYTNETYFLRLTFTNVGYSKGAFAGYLQPRAIAFENNPDSPFYVGYATEHICNRNSISVNFVDEDYSGYIAEYTIVGNNGEADLDITTALDYKTFKTARVGDSWPLKIKAVTNDVPITTINLTYGGGAQENFDTLVSGGTTHEDYNVITSGTATDVYAVTDSITITLDDQSIYKDSTLTLNQEISLDFDSNYLITVQKISTGTDTYSLAIVGSYYPIPAENWPTPTTKIHNLPKFTKMVRGVFSGDDYDNIYTNDLALQRAKYELYLNCRLHDTISIDCVPLYWLDVNKLMTYTANNQAENDQWIIKSISTDISVSGSQSVSAMRYYPLYNS